MALSSFKPFEYNRPHQEGLRDTIKNAKKIVEKKGEGWDVWKR
jgi:DNA-directed RNA polymerase beta' subunit